MEQLSLYEEIFEGKKQRICENCKYSVEYGDGYWWCCNGGFECTEKAENKTPCEYYVDKDIESLYDVLFGKEE